MNESMMPVLMGLYDKGLIVTCGCPGSGKSTFVSKLMSIADDPDIFSVVCPDDLRVELLGDESDQSANDLIFEEAYKRARMAVAEHKNVIFDATMCRRQYRMRLLDELGGYFHYSVLYTNMPNVSLAECIKRNNSRQKPVPRDIVERMYREFWSEYPTPKDDCFDLIVGTPLDQLERFLTKLLRKEERDADRVLG